MLYFLLRGFLRSESIGLRAPKIKKKHKKKFFFSKIVKLLNPSVRKENGRPIDVPHTQLWYQTPRRRDAIKLSPLHPFTPTKKTTKKKTHLRRVFWLFLLFHFSLLLIFNFFRYVRGRVTSIRVLVGKGINRGRGRGGKRGDVAP